MTVDRARVENYLYLPLVDQQKLNQTATFLWPFDRVFDVQLDSEEKVLPAQCRKMTVPWQRL